MPASEANILTARDLGPRTPATGLSAAVTTDNAIVTQTMLDVLRSGGKPRCIIGNSMVLKNGRPVYSAGSPGNFHCTLPQVLSYLLEFGLDPQSAVDAPRMLPMNEQRGISIEDRLDDGVVEGLHALGIRIGVVPGYDYHMGSFPVIARNEADGTYTAMADPRRTAVADGIRT
jgi:gamma-glutamyltranspeptidase / glutathione hydrolase